MGQKLAAIGELNSFWLGNVRLEIKWFAPQYGHCCRAGVRGLLSSNSNTFAVESWNDQVDHSTTQHLTCLNLMLSFLYKYFFSQVM